MKSRSSKLTTLGIARNNRRDSNEYPVRSKVLSCALCLALALPGIAAAKKPSSGTAVSCAVLLPAEIYTGSSFTVKVDRVPSYPGSWSQPTIAIDVVYPDNVVTQNNTQTISRFNVTYALAAFTVPAAQDASILTTSTNAEATATVTATVSEPLSNNRVRETSCSATTPVVQGS